MMCPPCPEVLEHLGTHTALFITIVNNYSVGFQMQKKGNIWYFGHLRTHLSQAAAICLTFWEIKRSLCDKEPFQAKYCGESPLVDNFGPEFGQEGIHPEWTRWPKCVSQSQLGSVVVPFAHVIRDRCGSFGKVNAHVKCGLFCLCLLFLNGRGDFKNYLQRNTERENI